MNTSPPACRCCITDERCLRTLHHQYVHNSQYWHTARLTRKITPPLGYVYETKILQTERDCRYAQRYLVDGFGERSTSRYVAMRGCICWLLHFPHCRENRLLKNRRGGCVILSPGCIIFSHVFYRVLSYHTCFTECCLITRYHPCYTVCYLITRVIPCYQ